MSTEEEAPSETQAQPTQLEGMAKLPYVCLDPSLTLVITRLSCNRTTSLHFLIFRNVVVQLKNSLHDFIGKAYAKGVLGNDDEYFNTHVKDTLGIPLEAFAQVLCSHFS